MVYMYMYLSINENDETIKADMCQRECARVTCKSAITNARENERERKYEVA